MLAEVQKMRAGLAGFVRGSEKRALTRWIEHTFEAFHIMAGGDGLTKWKLRKAVRRWVSRSHVRKGLRKMVFTTAQKGKDLRLLLQMMEMAAHHISRDSYVYMQPPRAPRPGRQ